MFESKAVKFSSLLFISGFLLISCGVDPEEDADNDTPDEVFTLGEDDESVSGDDTDEESDEEAVLEDDVEVAQDLEVWFPKYENTLLDFEGFGNEFAPFTRYPQFVHDTTMQVKDSTGGTDVVRVFEYSENEIREIFVRGETYFRDDVMETGLDSLNEEEIILQLPIEVGHSWESSSGHTVEITDVGFDFETEFGTFNAIEVTRYEEEYNSVYYYAEDVGLVEQIFNPGDEASAITSTLVSRQENQPEELSMLVFSLNDQADKLINMHVRFGLNTNEPVRTKLAEIFRGQAPEASINALISENTEINYMYLGNDDIAYIDFSAELTQEMQAGAGVEELMIQGIVDTVGVYYGVQEVLLTVDGHPYSSGHFELSEGETWPVEYDEGAMK